MEFIRIRPIFLASLLLLSAACGSETADTPGSASDDESMPKKPTDGPASTPGEALRISNRTYVAGSVKAKVTGFFSADGTQQLNLPASITDDGSTWLQYGVSGAQELNVLFTNTEGLAEHGVNVSIGPYTVTATSTSGECQPRIDVTLAKVTGHYSCKGSTGYNNKTGQMGKVDIEVDFDASS
jgi:hypothetical protein